MTEYKIKLDRLLKEYIELKSKLIEADKQIYEHILTKPSVLED